MLLLVQAAKPAAQPSPPSVDFSVDQFSELMEQIDTGGNWIRLACSIS